MDEYVNLVIQLRKDTYEEIQNFIVYKNVRNKFEGKRGIKYDINDFVSGCVNYYMKQIEDYINLSGYDDLGKPFQLKNKFKEKFKELGLKNKEISEITGINESNLSASFKNRNQLSLDYFLRLWVLAEYPPINEVLYREND